MRIPSELPEGIAGRPAFGSVEARRLGVTKARLAASDLITPYRGSRLVRSDVDATLPRLASAYATRMPASQFLSHSTAALLNDVPLPLHLETDRRLHVSVLAGGARPRVRGVIGHVVDPGRTGILASGGLRMTDAATTWCQLGALLDVDDLVAAGDFLITGREPIGGRRPVATIGLLADAVDRHGGTAGVGRLRMALPCSGSGRSRGARRSFGSGCSGPGSPSHASITRCTRPGMTGTCRSSTSRSPSIASPSSTRATTIGSARSSGATSGATNASRTADGTWSG